MMLTRKVSKGHLVDPARAGPEPFYSGVEDIIVTAEKRSESAQRTPAAVTAITGAALSQRGLTDNAASWREKVVVCQRRSIDVGSRLR